MLLLLLLLPLLLLLLVITVVVAAIVVSISISFSTINYVVTCVGLRKHRARGRICPPQGAANASRGAMCHLASQDDTSLILTLVAHIPNSISIPFSVSVSIFIASAAAAVFAAASYMFLLLGPRM